MSHTAPERFRPRYRRRWWPVPLFLLLLLLFLAWTGWETRSAMVAVDEATAQVNMATDSLAEGDISEAIGRIENAGQSTQRAARAADSIPMRVLGSIPWVGRDVRAARVTVHAVDGAVQSSVLPLLESVEQIKAAQDRAPEGTVAVDALQEQTPALEKAAKAAQDAYAPLAGIDPSSLLFLDGQVAQAQTKVGQLATMSAQAECVVKLAPYLLGADEPRSYLLVFANLSEERPTGGLYGSWALVDVDDGEVSLAATGSNDGFEGIPAPWRDAPEDVQELYGEDLTAHQNVNLSPDFPVGAQLISQVWQRATSRPAPDGVIAVTPVALADALAATGPIDVTGGAELTSENAVSQLQNEVYTTHPVIEERNAYLGRVTGQVFSQVLSTGMTSPGLLQHLGSAASTGHIQAWFSDPQAQELVADLPVGGVLPAEPDPDEVRLYLTNTDASKLGQFTHLTVTQSCESDAAQLRTQFRYEPDPDAPDYVVGLFGRREPRLAHRFNISLYLPPNRGVRQVQLDGRPLELQVGQEKGWTVARADVQLDPDTTSTITWDLDGTQSLPHVVVQPLTNAPELPAPEEIGRSCG